MVVDAGLGGHPGSLLKVAVSGELVRPLQVHVVHLVIEHLVGVNGDSARVEVAQVAGDLAPAGNLGLLQWHLVFNQVFCGCVVGKANEENEREEEASKHEQSDRKLS